MIVSCNVTALTQNLGGFGRAGDASAAITPSAASGVVQALYLYHIRRHDLLEDQLRNTVPDLHCARRQGSQFVSECLECTSMLSDAPLKSSPEWLKRMTPTSPR